MDDLRALHRGPERAQAGWCADGSPQDGHAFRPSQRAWRCRIMWNKGDPHLRVVGPPSDQQIGLDFLAAEPLPQRGTYDEQLDRMWSPGGRLSARR